MSDRDDAGRVVDVRVVLPDHWWRIPLQPPQARERSVDRLIERRFAGVDDNPQLRADTRSQLLKQAEDAAAVDGELLALSLQEVEGVPVPASLTLYWMYLPPEPGTVRGDGEIVQELRDELEPGGAAGLDRDVGLDITKVAAGTVMRRVHETAAELHGAEPVAALIADYWVERPDGLGVVYLNFSTPLLGMREALLCLFDAVVSAMHWVRADENDGSK